MPITSYDTLPAVSWIAPSGDVSEHPPGKVTAGQAYVTDTRPDPRPDVRENAAALGNLLSDFDFTQTPRPALPLPEHPATTLR